MRWVPVVTAVGVAFVAGWVLLAAGFWWPPWLALAALFVWTGSTALVGWVHVIRIEDSGLRWTGALTAWVPGLALGGAVATLPGVEDRRGIAAMIVLLTTALLVTVIGSLAMPVVVRRWMEARTSDEGNLTDPEEAMQTTRWPVHWLRFGLVVVGGLLAGTAVHPDRSVAAHGIFLVELLALVSIWLYVRPAGRPVLDAVLTGGFLVVYPAVIWAGWIAIWLGLYPGFPLFGDPSPWFWPVWIAAWLTLTAVGAAITWGVEFLAQRNGVRSTSSRSAVG